jgi:putative ABC transport system permease protein
MLKFKYIIYGFRNNKLKALLVFFTTLITILIFNVSSSFQDSVIDTRLSQLRELTLNSQIFITKADGTYGYFDPSIVNIVFEDDNVDSTVNRCVGYGYTDISDDLICIYGIDVAAQREVYEYKLISGSLDAIRQSNIAVSEKYADEQGLKIDDTICLLVGDKKEEVKIAAICASEGFYKDTNNTFITSLELAQSILGVEEKINYIDITVKELEKTDITVQRLNDTLKTTGLTAAGKYDMSYYNAFVSTVVLAINLFGVFLILISMFVLLNVYRSYSYDNIKEMATLRSIGFTVRRYRLGICCQALFITMLSFIISLILTPVSIRVLAMLILQNDVNVHIRWGESLLKNAMVFLIIFLSVWLSTGRASRLSVIDIIKGEISKKEVSRLRKGNLIWAFILFILLLILSFINSIYKLLWMNYILLIGIFLLFLLAQGGLISLYGSGLKHMFSGMKGALGLFGKQIKDSLIAYLQAITTISCVIALSLIIFSMSDMLENAMSKVYQNADLYITIYNKDYEEFTNILAKDDEIASCIIQKRSEIIIDDKQVIISGIDVDQYDDEDFAVILNNGNHALFEQLKGGHKVIISDTLTKNLNLQEDDILNIKGMEYKIVGIVKSFENMGKIMYISDISFRDTFDYYDYCIILAKTKSSATTTTVEKRLFERMKELGGFSITTLERMAADNMASNQMILRAVLILTVFILIISGVSLFSIVIINVISRLRDFLIFHSLGISKKDIVICTIYEGITLSLYGILSGMLCQVLVLPIIVNILSYYVGDMDIILSFKGIGLLFIASWVLITAILLGVIRKHILKSNLIERVKLC